MAKWDATQDIHITLWTTEEIEEKLAHIFDKDSKYEVDFSSILDKQETDGINYVKYHITWYIFGQVTFYRSNSWYEPDEYEYDECFIYPDDTDTVYSMILDYARAEGIDTELIDIEYVNIYDVEPK